MHTSTEAPNVKTKCKRRPQRFKCERNRKRNMIYLPNYPICCPVLLLTRLSFCRDWKIPASWEPSGTAARQQPHRCTPGECITNFAAMPIYTLDLLGTQRVPLSAPPSATGAGTPSPRGPRAASPGPAPERPGRPFRIEQPRDPSPAPVQRRS